MLLCFLPLERSRVAVGSVEDLFNYFHCFLAPDEMVDD